jgi:hypothetical protein
LVLNQHVNHDRGTVNQLIQVVDLRSRSGQNLVNTIQDTD